MALKVIGLVTAYENTNGKEMDTLSFDMEKAAINNGIGMLQGNSAYSFGELIDDATYQLNFELLDTPRANNANLLFEYDRELFSENCDKVVSMLKDIFKNPNAKLIDLYFVDSKKNVYLEDIEEVELICSRYKEAMQDMYEENSGKLAISRFTFMDRERGLV